MAQYALPIANSGTTTWTEISGDGDGDWFDELDEGFGAGRGSGSGPDDDITVWQSPTNPVVTDIIETALSAVTDPGVHTGHIVRTRNSKSIIAGHQIDLTIELRQTGLGLIASRTFTNINEIWTTREFTLTEVEAGTITDYSALVIRDIPEKIGGGQPRTVRESAHELEVPDAPAVSDFGWFQQGTDIVAAAAPTISLSSSFIPVVAAPAPPTPIPTQPQTTIFGTDITSSPASMTGY